MINNNKILTVSYGTFSCTLEGFDDSFGTMKAIAEYFRDLAADDRYFGAEPAQPDAQMLARIAQREISRHVDAREDDGRIVLSARNTPQTAALVAQDAVEDVATAVAKATGARTARITTEEIEDDTDADLRAAAPEGAAAPKASVMPRPVLSVTAQEAEAQRANDDAPVSAEVHAIVPSLPDAEVEAFFAETPATAPEAFDDDTTENPAQERIRADSIADKLKRIRAVVSQQTAEPAPSNYSEDQHAGSDALRQPDASEDEAPDDIAPVDEAFAEAHSDAVVTEKAQDEETSAAETSAANRSPESETADDAPLTGGVLENTLRDVEEALDADDANDAGQSAAEYVETDESEDDDIAAILNRLEREAEAAGPDMAAPQTITNEDFYDEDEDLDGSFDDDDLDDDADERDENILAAMDAISDPREATEARDSDVDAGENMFDDSQAGDSPAPVAHSTLPSEPEHKAPVTANAAPRTRVLKVKRATLEAAIRSGQLEEYDDEEDEERAPAPRAALRPAPLARRSTLSDEAEEELARELAELEADMAAQGTAGPASEAATKEHIDDAQDTPATPATRTEIKGEAEDNLSRLMDESDQQMEEPESATRRDAFAHLRAAVAAKKADDAVGGAPDETESDVAYRDDLANVVRPRRPASGDRPRTERPAEQRPAPLKLVAEQRIDVGQPRVVTPVRPRRVAAVEIVHAAHDSQTDTSSFSEFAAEMGAHKLPDLLEAAAAYLSFVEGHAQFSRPQLMTKVRQVEQENFTREDSLRSFGKLLREGKIEKLEGGRFQASDQIGFKPDARAAG
jgi:hypothetical protein